MWQVGFDPSLIEVRDMTFSRDTRLALRCVKQVSKNLRKQMLCRPPCRMWDDSDFSSATFDFDFAQS
jgi:hypothetical protein